MWKIYFKQTIALLKQNKVISIVSIIGTALAIMMVMVQILIMRINDSNMAPEINRDRVLHLKNQKVIPKNPNSFSSSGNLLYDNYKDYLSDLKTPELVSVILPDQNIGAILKVEDLKKFSHQTFFTQTTIIGKSWLLIL